MCCSLILVITIGLFVAVPFALYVGSGYSYQHNPDARKDLIEHI